MSELPGFPIVSQLDGSENEQQDCVAASICAALRYYNSGQTFATDAIKDTVYYDGYVGPTEIWKYVDYCERNGVQLYPVYGANLVAIAHAALASGYAVLVTEQDDYAPPEHRSDWTHVCVFHKDRPGYLTAMDPYAGHDIEYSDEQWRQRMRSDCVWLMRRGGKMQVHIVNGWVREATEIDYGNKSFGRNGWAPKIVVIHGTAGGNSARDTAAWFRDSDVESSAHVIIDRSGEIVQGISFAMAAWGNGPTTAGHAPFLPDSNQVNGNWYTLSVELEKPHDDNSDTITDAQKASLYALADAFCLTYGIPRKIATDMSGGFLGHKDFDPVNRSRCPGTFDWNDFIAHLTNGGGQNDMLSTKDPWVAAHYDDIGNGQLKDKKSGVVVGGNVLKYVLITQFACRLVLTGEQSIGKRAKYVVAESAIIMFDPDHEFDNPSMPNNYQCYYVKLTSDLARNVIAKDLFDKIAAQQKQIDALNQQLASTQNQEKLQLQQELDAANARLGSLTTALTAIQGEIGAALAK